MSRYLDRTRILRQIWDTIDSAVRIASPKKALGFMCLAKPRPLLSTVTVDWPDSIGNAVFA